MHNKNLYLIPIISFLSMLLLSACRMYYNDSDLEQIQEKTFSMDRGKELKMKVSGSDVLIKSWKKPEVYIKVLGNKKARSDADINYSADEDRIEITTRNENDFHLFGNNVVLKFEIFVPDSFNTDIRTSGGTLDLYAIKGNQHLRTSGGDVILEDIHGPVDAHTSGGTISGTNIMGNSQVSTSGGNIVYKSFTGDLDASTSGGTIVMQGSNSRINAETSGGDVRLDYTGENKGINLQTSGGTIEIKVPENFRADADLSTSGGTINCNLSGIDISTLTDHKLAGTFNGGGNSLSARTSGGDIKVIEKK